MARVEPAYIQNKTRWSQKPAILGKARSEWVACGLKFLCAFESKNPLERTRMIPATSTLTTGSTAPTPSGRGLRISPYSTQSLFFDKFTDLDLTGALTILHRGYHSTLYYPTHFGKVVGTTSGFAWGTDLNIPVAFGSNNYYTYGEPRIIPSVYRANATGYKAWSDTASSTYQPPNNCWLDMGLFMDAAIESTPQLYFDGMNVPMGGSSGTGTGRATNNAGNIHLSNYDYQDETNDWVAVFGRRLTIHEAVEIFRAPFGELFEAPESERRLFLLAAPASASGTTYNVTASDALAGNDATSTLQTLAGNITDAGTLADVADRVSTFTRNLSDALAGTDSAGSTWSTTAAIADALVGVDSAASGAAFVSTASDSLAGSDATTAGAAYVVTGADALAGNDAAASFLALISTASDSGTLADAASVGTAFLASASDALVGTDATVNVLAFLSTVADALVGSDASNVSGQFQAAVADALAGNDVPLARLTAIGTIAEPMVLADGTQAVAVLRVSIADALVGTDAASAPSATTYVVNVTVLWSAAASPRVWSATPNSTTWN